MAEVPMPTLIRWGYRISLFLGIFTLFVALFAAVGWGDTSGLKELPFGEWNLPVWGVNALVGGGFLTAIGYSLRAKHPGSRKLIVAFWIASLLMLIAEYS